MRWCVSQHIVYFQEIVLILQYNPQGGIIHKYICDSITAAALDRKTFLLAFLLALSYDLRSKQLGILFVAGKTYMSHG